MQIFLLAVATISGLFFAWVDSQPTWDDTGVLAGAILLTCGAIGLLGGKRPWLAALLVGGWIPLRGLLVTHNSGSVLALVFALAGAYGGWALRAGVRKALHPA